MKRIFSILTILFIFTTFIACSGGGSSSTDSNGNLIFKSKGSGSATSSDVKRTAVYNDVDQYCGTGFTHIDALLFEKYPAAVAYQVDEGVSDTANITRWDISKETVDTDWEDSDLSVLTDAGTFKVKSANAFWSVASDLIVPTPEPVVNMDGVIVDVAHQRYNAVDAPATMRVDYMRVQISGLDVYGITGIGTKSCFYSFYPGGMGAFRLEHNAQSERLLTLAISKGIFTNARDYNVFGFDTTRPLIYDGRQSFIFTPHVTKPIIVQMNWVTIDDHVAPRTTTAHTFTDGVGVNVIYDGGNDAATLTKVTKDLWRTFKCLIPEDQHSGFNANGELFYIYPMAQYVSDPSKVAVVNIGAYTSATDGVSITMDIQKTIGMYDDAANEVTPVVTGTDWTKLTVPWNMDIKFADSVLAQ